MAWRLEVEEVLHFGVVVVVVRCSRMEELDALNTSSPRAAAIVAGLRASKKA